MGTRLRRLFLVLAASALAGPAATGQEDPETLLGDPAATDAVLRERLASAAASLADAPTTFHSPGLSTWSTGDENDRRLFHKNASEFHNRCHEALIALGFAPPDAGALRMALRVTVPGAVPRTTLSADGQSILVSA